MTWQFLKNLKLQRNFPSSDRHLSKFQSLTTHVPQNWPEEGPTIISCYLISESSILPALWILERALLLKVILPTNSFWQFTCFLKWTYGHLTNTYLSNDLTLMQISLLDFTADYFILHLNKIHPNFLLSKKHIVCTVIIESRQPRRVYENWLSLTECYFRSDYTVWRNMYFENGSAHALWASSQVSIHSNHFLRMEEERARGREVPPWEAAC